MADYLHGIAVAAQGVPTTLIISLVAVLAGLIIGLFVAIAKMSKHRILRGIATVYVDVLRGTPLMVQVLILAYGLPQLLKSNFGIQFNWTHFIIVGFIACGINSSAYMAEIIRSGLQAVDIGQTEAARSLGMSSRMTMRYVIVPQAFKIIVPAMGNEFITLFKDTALITVIGGKELLYAAQGIMNRTYEAMFPLCGVALVYLILVMLFTWLLAKFERRMAQGDR